ncbi:MAG: T9SS type A sorting domain-containing protein [Elusimicrobia bacterium]|nr:T9SS type A sorting domain-containing protein [Elusimicrobiota bacterium]
MSFRSSFLVLITIVTLLGSGQKIIQASSDNSDQLVWNTASKASAADLSGAYAFPVPFKPSLNHDKITFINLSAQATVKIYSLDGNLVKTLHESDSDGILEWDAKNEDGEPVKSDVYVYRIESSEQKKVGKLLVVR